MMLVVYSVRDFKSGAFAPPFFSPRDESAVRAFADAVLGGDGYMLRHPEDFALFALGDYNDATGMIAGYEAPRALKTAAAVVQEHQAARPPLPIEEAIDG